MISKQLRKLENENEEQFLWRLGQLYDAGLIDCTWPELADILNRTFRPEGIEYTESTYRKDYRVAKRFFDAGVFNDLNNNDYLKELSEKRLEIEKERVKLRTEKIEYSKWKREEARDELITEQIVQAIHDTSRDFKRPDPIESQSTEKGYVLLFGDEHYGAEFEIKGLKGEIINAYSPEIFEKRMWDLLDQTIEIICNESITDLHVFALGDCVDGCLRVSQLMKLRYGVVDGTVRYAEFIAEWLRELSNYVNVHFQMTNGNHTELRMLGQPKGTFTEDNMGKVIASIIKARLKDNPNFQFTENPTGYIFENIVGYNFLGIHGEEKDLKRSIKDFSSSYNTNVDYLVCGHIHHGLLEEVGMSSEVITTPSIMGTDPYAFKLKYLAHPGAKLLVIQKDYGRKCEHSIVVH